MKAAPIKKSIRVGSLSIAIRGYADGRIGFDFQPPGERRVQVRLHELADAERRAREILGMAHGGKVERLAIDEREYAEFLRWKGERAKPALIADLVPEFLESKKSKGVSIATIREMQSTLRPFALAFPGQIGSLSQKAVEKWLGRNAVSPRRWNNMRAAIIALHRYARRYEMLHATLTPVERIESKKVKVQVATFTPSELQKLLAAVAAQTPEWLPWVALGAFAGLRPEEINPDPRNHKPGLLWENIHWAKGKIDVPANVAKDRRRRFAPLLEAARLWLAPWRSESGPVVPLRRHQDAKAAWLRTTGIEWKKDGLRHSFASYRLAITHDMAALSLEMGNSPTMIFRHYLDLKDDDDARAWFGTLPSHKSTIRRPPESHESTRS